MNRFSISDCIAYIPCSDSPLSADIGIIHRENSIWLYDVGNNPQVLSSLSENYNVVLSHFHQDHTGNLSKIHIQSLYVSSETQRHVSCGDVVHKGVFVDGLRIFPLPSSHCKGCLGLEVDGTYAFVGDGLYSKFRDGYYIFNAQLLKDEITVLKRLSAPNLLVSHYKGMVRPREEVIAELEGLYAQREKDCPEILVKA